MLIPDTCSRLFPIASIFLTLTLHTAGAPNTVGDGVASRVIEALAAQRPSQSLQSSVSVNSSYRAANSTTFSTLCQSTQSFSPSNVPNTIGEIVASKVMVALAAHESSQSLPSFVSAISYTAVTDTNPSTPSQLNHSAYVSSVPNTAADWLASTVAGQQSASFTVTLASLQRFTSPHATDSTQSVTITVPPPVSTSPAQSLVPNGTLTPLPNVATVIMNGTSQVIYKQTFTNLHSITAAENITTVLTQYNSQSTSNALFPVVAPVAIVVGAAGIWYRVGTTGPPIGPPELPMLTIGGGRPLFCVLFPFFCPGTTPSSPPVPPGPPSLPDTPGNGQNPPNAADDPGNRQDSPNSVENPESESEKASQSRGEPTSMPSSTQTPTTQATYSAQSQTTRSLTSTSNSTTRSVSSTQPLVSFNWVTQIPSPDPLFLTTSDNFSAMASLLQAEFTSLGIAFDQEDAMAGLGPVSGTNATMTSASLAGNESNISATATNGTGIAAAAATMTATVTNGPATVSTLMVSTSSTAGPASSSAAVLVPNTVPAAANEPSLSSLTQPPLTTPPPTASPISVLACTLS